jgi:putative ABC transport system ATP-binding protein
MARRTSSNRRALRVVPRVVAGVLAVAALVWLGVRVTRKPSAPPVEYRTASVDLGTIRAKVNANGTLSALVTVSVGSQVSGRIESLRADFGSHVTKGDVVATIEPAMFRAAAAQANANYAAAVAAVASSEARVLNAERQFERARDLNAEGLVTGAEYEAAEATLAVARADLTVSRANVKQARAARDQADLNLRYTTIGRSSDCRGHGGIRPAVATMSTEPIIVADSLVKTYALGGDELRALDRVSVTVSAGEFVAIMGPSGSGKSTLMNVLGCLDRPTSGKYRLAGRDVAELGRGELAVVRNRLLGFVFQNFNLLPRTSALENVELPLVYAGVPRRVRSARAREALNRVGLGDRLRHYPSQLSGGQQQRVAVARAIVNGPRLLLADEPTGNLDSKTSASVMALFQELADDGLTTVFVTHEPDVASYASRVITMRDGRIASDSQQAARRAAADGAGVRVA